MMAVAAAGKCEAVVVSPVMTKKRKRSLPNSKNHPKLRVRQKAGGFEIAVTSQPLATGKGFEIVTSNQPLATEGAHIVKDG